MRHQTLTTVLDAVQASPIYSNCIWNVMGLFNDVEFVGNLILCGILSEFYCFGYISGWKCDTLPFLFAHFNSNKKKQIGKLMKG